MLQSTPLSTPCWLYCILSVYIYCDSLNRWKRKKKQPEYEPKKLHRFAFIIAARNENAVIGNLIKSIKAQNYPSELIDVVVVADNCTDNTAEIARSCGAIVYERFNKVLVGKGYALDYAFNKIKEDEGDYTAYDGYFIFDADNVIDRNYVREMNKTFDQGYRVVTSYRNSKISIPIGLHQDIRSGSAAKQNILIIHEWFLKQAVLYQEQAFLQAVRLLRKWWLEM